MAIRQDLPYYPRSFGLMREGALDILIDESGLVAEAVMRTSANPRYDTLALAYLVDSSYATDVVERWVDVDVNWGPSYGRTLGSAELRIEHGVVADCLDELTGHRRSVVLRQG